MNREWVPEIVIFTSMGLIIIVSAILITREETLQSVCEEKGGLFIKSRCVKVEFVR